MNISEKEFLKLKAKYSDLNLNQYTDYGFTQTEILRLKEAFDLFDIEEKGILDINTLQKSLNELGIMSKNKDLQNLDMEGKKEIDFNTFVELFGARPVCRTEEEAKKLYSVFLGDYDLNRKLSVDDLIKVRMNTRSTIKNAILCLMALNSPRDFDNGDPVTLDKTNASQSNSKENHHFFPYSLHSEFGVTQQGINAVLNFAFISKRLNQDITNNYPSEYLANYERSNSNITSDLSSHFITEEAFISAKADDFNGFLRHRGSRILEEINKVCRTDEGKGEVSMDDEIIDEVEEIEED